MIFPVIKSSYTNIPDYTTVSVFEVTSSCSNRNTSELLAEYPVKMSSRKTKNFSLNLADSMLFVYM